MFQNERDSDYLPSSPPPRETFEQVPRTRARARVEIIYSNVETRSIFQIFLKMEERRFEWNF